MVTYRTIFGQEIMFGQLPVNIQSIILRVVALAAAHKNDAFEFVNSCRSLFRLAFVQKHTYNAAMRGPIGIVYRDYFYLIHADGMDENRREEFLVSLRHNPLRLLFDRFLDGTWQHQADFAEDSGLAEAQVTRAFKNVLEESLSGEISVQKLSMAFNNLNIVPGVCDNSIEGWLGTDLGGDAFYWCATAPTGREWMLVLVTSSITRRLCQIRSKETLVEEIKVCRDVLARYLGFIYGIQDVNQLTDFTYRVLREMLTTVPLSQEVSNADLLQMVINPDEVSFRLATTKVLEEKLSNGGTCYIVQEPNSVDGQLFLPDPSLSEKETTAVRGLTDSEWAKTVEDTWAQSRDLVSRWSLSHLAESGLEKILKDLKLP